MTATTRIGSGRRFYQIFPDRFARSSRVYKPDYLCDWGAPPTYHNFMGGDLLRCCRETRLYCRFGRQCTLPEPHLYLGF